MDAILGYIGKPKSDLDIFDEMDWQFVFAVILSSQTTDIQVNKVTPTLFTKFPTLQHFVDANIVDVEEVIKSIPFFRNKAKSLKESAVSLLANGGKIPDTMEELLKLRGVGRKVANVILTYVHGKAGVVTDTHVIRVTNRLGWVSTVNPTKIEIELVKLIPEKQQIEASNALVLFGRYTCIARKPLCDKCPINSTCPSSQIGV